MAEVVVDSSLPVRLQTDAAAMGVVLDDAAAARLAGFADLLLRWNRAFNLISRKDEGRLVPRHLLDSLSVVDWLRGPDVLDLGTGGGLPGIPLAIARPDLRFTLLDRSPRKVRFVAQAARALNLANVNPLCSEVEALAPEMRFDCIVSRAVKDLQGIWALAAPRLRGTLGEHGRLLAMVSTRGDDLSDGAHPAELPGGRLVARPGLTIPGLSACHRLDVVEKLLEPDALPQSGH